MALSRVMTSWRRDVEHLLLHVHAWPDALHHRDEDVQARLQRRV